MWESGLREEQEVEWSRVDAATTHLTRLNRSFLQHNESCSCLEELVRQEESEQEELTAEVEHLRRSTHGRAIRGPQLSITEASLQSSLELIREHILDVERENQRVEEELRALTKRLDDVRQAHLSQLDRVKAQYGERIMESGHLECQRKLDQLRQQKAILNSRVTTSRMEHQGRALEEWKEMRQEVVQLAGGLMQLRNQKNRNDQLNTAIQMLQMTIRTTREEAAAVSIQQQQSSSRMNFPSCSSFDTSPEHLTNKHSKSGHSYVQYLTPATSNGQVLDTQQLINPVSEESHRQNTLRCLTPEKTRQDIQQCLTRASTNNLQKGTLRGLIPYTAEWQRQETQQYFTHVTVDKQRQETQQCLTPATVDRQRQDTQQSLTHVTVDGQRLETQKHFTPVTVDGQREEKQQCLTPVTLGEQRQETQQSLTHVTTDGQRQGTQQCLTPVKADGQKQETQQHLTLTAGDRQRQEPLQCLSITGDGQRQETQHHLSPATTAQQRLGTPRGKMFNSNLSLLKLQFPKYGERKRMSTSLTETFSSSGIMPVITKSSVCQPSDVSLKQPQSRTTSLTSNITPARGLLKGLKTDINCSQSVNLERRHSDGVALNSGHTPSFEMASTCESGSLARRTADKLPVSSSCTPPAAFQMQSSPAGTQEEGLNQKELVSNGALGSPLLPNKRARHTVISSLVPSPEIQFQQAPALLRLVYKIEANEQQTVTSHKDTRYQHPVTLCARPSPEASDIMAAAEAERGQASATAVPEAPTTSVDISQASASILEVPTLAMETCPATTVSPLAHSQTTALTSAHPRPTTSPLAHHQPVTSHLAHHQPVTSHLAHHQPVTSLPAHPQPTTSPLVHPQPPTSPLVHHQPTASPSPYGQPTAATSPEAYSCHTDPSQVVDNPLSSSQGFSLIEDPDSEETNTTYSSETMDMTEVCGNMCTSSLIMEFPASRNVSVLSASLPQSLPSASSVTTETSESLYFSATPTHTSSSVAREKRLNKVILPKDSPLNSQPLFFSSPLPTSLSSQIPVNTPVKNMETSSESVYKLSPIFHSQGVNPPEPSMYQPAGDSCAFMIGENPEDRRITGGALSLFGSPETQSSVEGSAQENAVNFSLFGEPSSPRADGGSFFNFNFGNDSSNSQDSGCSGFFSSLFGSPTQTTGSSQDGAGFKLF